MIKYALFENSMTSDPSDRVAVTQINQSLTLEEVFEQMSSRGSTVTRAEALSVFEELCLAIVQLVKAGNSVNTPLFNISPSISGVFDGDDDTFDASRHKVKLRINPGSRLREVERQISVEKVSAERPQPTPLRFYDNTSESQDDVITPGGGARLVGTLLKYDEDDTQQGIFFVNTSTSAATRVNGKLLRNKPGELIFVIPNELVPGAYRMDVRTVMKGTKALRTGALPYELTVA